MNNYIKSTVCCLLAAIAAVAQSTRDVNAYHSSDVMIDNVGIYYAAKGRMAMTIDDWQPYVTHTFLDGHTEWFFEGFVFEDLSVNDHKLIHMFKRTDVVYANKSDWTDLMDLLFVQDRLLDALDKCIEANKKTLGDPPFRHKVVISIPMAIKGQTEWGKIDGKGLNFNSDRDRIKALKWYVDEVLKRYRTHSYKNFDLLGFYWLEEDMEQTKGLAAQMSEYIHKLGYKHIWAPYLKASGVNNWATYGFDYCGVQIGGYNFNLKRELQVVYDACDKAKKRGMGIVMEFAASIITDQDTFLPRIKNSLDVLEQRGVFDYSDMGYYDAGGLFHDIAVGTRKGKKIPAKELRAAREVVDRMATHIVNRYHKHYGYTKPPKGSEGNGSSGNSGGGSINDKDDWRNPDYWRF